MAKTTTRKTPKAEIAALRAEAEGLQGTTFATLKPKLATLVGALENLQRGNSATEAQRKAVVEALQQVKTDPSFQYSNGVTSALEFISDLKRLQGAGSIDLDAIPAEKPASKPADAEKIEAIESASSRVLGIRQTMDSKVNQDVFELTGNFVTIANKWAGSQTRNASKPEKLAASNLALSEAIWELTKLGEDLLAEYGLKEIVGELVNLHGATKPETPHSRGTTIKIEPRVVPVAIDPRDATEETLPEALKKFSDSLADGTQKAAFAELADAYAAYLAASDEERYKIGGVTWDTDQKLRAAINTITEEGTAKDLLRKCVATPDFRGLTTKLETADLLGSESYSEADLISRLASALDIELNTDAPKTVFDDLREKLLSDPFLDNLNYSHGVDRETVDQAIVYLAGQEHGERAARGFLKSFNGSDVTIDDRGFKNGFTKCALFLIATNHVMRNKINKTDHYKKLRDSLITEMAATVPPTLDGFVPAESPLPVSNEALAFTSGSAESASDELDFDTLLKEYVKDDLVADDVLFFINDQENAEALKTALKNALTNPEENAAILSALDDSISLAEYIRNIESLEERMLARLNGAEDVLESSEISYLRHTLQPKLDESEAAAISAAIEGRNIEGAADAVASIMLKQRELFSQEISEKLQSIDVAATAPALAINEEADKETVPEAIQQASALETLREKLARMETDVQNLPDTEEKADIQKTFTAFSARLEEFAATDVALEDFAESIDNYYISRANLGAAWEEFSKSVEFARNVNIDSKEYAALDTALDDLGDDLAAALSEQSAACIVYQSYVDSITQNLSHKPFKPAFLTWNGNINAVKNLKTILAGHPYNRYALDAVRLAQNTNSENTAEVHATRNLLKAIYAVKSGTNPMTEKPVRDALKYLISLGRTIEENASRSENTLETAETRAEEVAEEPVIPSLGAAQQQTAEADETPPQTADAPADATTDEADETNRLRTELHAKIKELFAIGGRIRNVYNIDLLRLRAMPDFSQKSLERLIKFTDIVINSDDKLEARKAIKTLASVWFDDREAAKEAWNTIKATIDDDRDARHFGHENLNLRNDLVSATRRLCEKAGISDEREISAVTFAALNSAAAGRDQQVRKGRLVYLHDYIKSVSENVPNEEAARLAHFAAGVQTLRNIDTPEAQAALVDSVKAYRQAKHEASVRAEMETLTDSLDELFAGRYDRATVPAAELQKYCKTPEQIHRISRYIDSMLQGRDDAKIKDAITTLKSVVSGEVQDRLAALSRIKAHVQALDNSEALDVDARSMAARVAASAPTDTGSERREPVLTTTGTRTNADSEPDLVAALGTARGPAAGTRRAPSLDDGVDARRTHIEEELRPEIGGDIDASHAYEAGQEPAGGWKDSWLWKAAQAAGRRWPTIAVGIGTGFYVKGALVATATTPLGPLLAAIAAGAFVGYAIGGQVSYHYMRRLDSNEAYNSGEQGFFRNRATELAAGIVAVTQLVAHTGKVYEFGTGNIFKGFAKGIGKNTIAATVIAPFAIAPILALSVRKTYLDNKGQKVGILSRLGQTLGNMKQIGGLYTEMMIGGIGGAFGGAAGAAFSNLDTITGGHVRTGIGNAVSGFDKMTGLSNGASTFKAGLTSFLSKITPDSFEHSIDSVTSALPSKADILRFLDLQEAGAAEPVVRRPELVVIDDAPATLGANNRLLEGAELPRGALPGTFDRTFPEGHALAGETHRYFKLPGTEGYLVRVVPTDGAPKFFRVTDDTLETLQRTTPIDPTKHFVETMDRGIRSRLFPNGDLETVSPRTLPGHGERFIRVFRPEGGTVVREVVTPDGRGDFRSLTPFEKRADLIVLADGDGGKLQAFLQNSAAWTDMKARVQELISSKVIKGADARLFERLITTAESGKPDAWRALNDLRASLSEGGVMDGDFVRRIPGMQIERLREGSTTIRLMQDLREFAPVFRNADYGLTTRGAKLNFDMSDAALDNKDVSGKAFGQKGAPSHTLDPVNTSVPAVHTHDVLARLNAKGFLATFENGQWKVTAVQTTRIPAFFDNPVESVRRNFLEAVDPTPTVALQSVYAGNNIGAAARLWQLHLIESGANPRAINAWTDSFNRGGPAATEDLFKKIQGLFRAGNGQLSTDELKFLRAYAAEARTTAGLRLRP